ncbi:MAG: hypothetical protein KF868_00705 [Acidobacteria bacterium]|nr:hypothetical protein [Acidobacteriota bacterium]MCW5969364.1 hypothetical protein [Blastocatellales bacterium]
MLREITIRLRGLRKAGERAACGLFARCATISARLRHGQFTAVEPVNPQHAHH